SNGSTKWSSGSEAARLGAAGAGDSGGMTALQDRGNTVGSGGGGPLGMHLILPAPGGNNKPPPRWARGFSELPPLVPTLPPPLLPTLGVGMPLATLGVAAAPHAAAWQAARTRSVPGGIPTLGVGTRDAERGNET